MNKLLAQLEKHSRKQFVPPPAEVSNATAGGGGGSFDVSMVMSDGKWPPDAEGYCDSRENQRRFHQ